MSKQAKPTLKLDGYIRVSRVNGREGDSFISPDVQRDKINAFARVMDARIVRWHTDLDESGGKLDRPGLNLALERIASRQTDGLVVAKIDRFARAAEAGAVVRRIIEAGGIFASADERLDPTTPMGKAMLQIVLVFAEMELDRVRDSWREAQRRAVERGIHIASKPPTGYRRSVIGANGKGEPVHGPLEPVPEYAPHVQRIFEMKAAKASWRDLALYLREHAVESPYGTTHWQPRALSHLIANRAYLGEARSGEFVNPTAHPPLVDEETWLAAQEAKGERPVNTMGGSLLAGLLRCDGCGYVLKPDTMSQRGTKRRLYRCRTERSSGRCPSPASVLGSVVEPFVVDAFFAGIGGMRAEGAAMADDLRDAERELQRAERELGTYLSAVSAADVGAEAFAVGARQRREAFDRASAAYAEARERAGLADLPLSADLVADWPDLSVAEKNRLLRSAFDAVVLERGRVPISERATIFWKGEGPVDLRSTRSVAAPK